MKLSQEDLNILHELFPSKPESYFVTISSSFNSLDTLIEYLFTDHNSLIEPIELTKSELILNTKSKIHFRKQEIQIKSIHVYNFPELFNNSYISDRNPQHYREEAQKLYERASQLNSFLFQRESNDYFNEEKESIIEKAKNMNYKAALIILKRILNNGILDFHGLFVKEAICFLEDYLWYYKPKKLRIITGRSERIKPKIVEWLKKRNFDVASTDTIIDAFLK